MHARNTNTMHTVEVPHRRASTRPDDLNHGRVVLMEHSPLGLRKKDLLEIHRQKENLMVSIMTAHQLGLGS